MISPGGLVSTLYTQYQLIQDPHIASSSLLLVNTTGNNFINNGTNGAAITTYNATASTFSPFATGASMRYSGAAGSYSATSMAAMGTTDCTYECWFYMPAAPVPTLNVLLNTRSGNTTDGFDIQISSARKIQLTYTNTFLYISTAVIPIQTWTHVAVSRVSGTITVYINGVADGTRALGNNFTSTVVTVGGSNGGTSPFNGYISNVRMTNGIARYTSNFAVPAAPFPIV